MRYISSVLLCTYNGEKYIAEQINSIINQTRKPDQIIISDDNSSDKTIEIVHELIKESEIDCLVNRNPERLGIISNFNKAFSLSKGDIIFLSDQDNVWDERYIELFMNKFEADSDLDYVFCNGYVTDENLNIIKPTYTDEFMHRDKEKFLWDAVKRTGFPHGHTVALKRTFKKRIYPPMFYDDEWSALCVAAIGKFSVIDKNLILFRRHPGAASNAERGGTKYRVKDVLNKSFEEYFQWPHLQYKAYKRYLELAAEHLPDDVLLTVKEHMAFEKEVNTLQAQSKIKCLISLMRLYKTDEYKLYRGNRNTFFLDSFFLAFHRKQIQG